MRSTAITSIATDRSHVAKLVGLDLSAAMKLWLRRFNRLDLKQWGLSKSVLELLSYDPELVIRLGRMRRYRSFPHTYRPQTIEVLYDDICWIKSIDGRIVYTHPATDCWLPTFIEVRFDRELAMFSIDCEQIIDRTGNLSSLRELLGTSD